MITELTIKNRERSPFTFANINLLGKCNMDCGFCLGKDLEEEFAKYDNLSTHFSQWVNFDNFLDLCRKHWIPQIYVTGQNTDSLLYHHLEELIAFLKIQGFFVGIRTNGLLARKKIDIVNQCTTCWGDAVSYSVHTLTPDTMQKMVGIANPPGGGSWEEYWTWVIQNTTAKLRVAIVLTRHNADEVMNLIDFLSCFHNVEYIQVRKVSTDHRIEILAPDLDAFENFVDKLNAENIPYEWFEKSKVYSIFGKKVSLWRTVGTSVNSVNFFTNGICSSEYFIIEGYEKAAGLKSTK